MKTLCLSFPQAKSSVFFPRRHNVNFPHSPPCALAVFQFVHPPLKNEVFRKATVCDEL